MLLAMVKEEKEENDMATIDRELEAEILNMTIRHQERDNWIKQRELEIQKKQENIQRNNREKSVRSHLHTP